MSGALAGEREIDVGIGTFGGDAQVFRARQWWPSKALIGPWLFSVGCLPLVRSAP